MGFPESLPTYLSLILRDHNASTLDKPCLVEHWRQPNAYSTHLFLSFSLFPSSHWLARPVFTHPHHHHRLWSGPLQCLQPARHNLQRMDASFDGLKRNPSLREESSHGTSVEKSRVLSEREKYGNGFSSITFRERHGRRGDPRGNRGKKRAVRQLSTLAAECRPSLERRVSCVYTIHRCTGVDALLSLREETGDGNGQVSNRRRKAHVMHCCVCLLGDTNGYVAVFPFFNCISHYSRSIPES